MALTRRKTNQRCRLNPRNGGGATPDPVELLRSRSYLVLLVFGAVVGVLAAVVAFFFLKAVEEVQHFIFTSLPTEVGFSGEPIWWPLPWLALAGLLVALTIHYLPGTAGHKPAEGFKTGGPVQPIELPGIVLASFATLSLGVVLGPEAPLIAIGSGLGVLTVRLVKRDAPAMAIAVIGGAGSFAAISTLLGSPIVGAFLLMEAAGIGGAILGVVLVPGLLAAGIGSLIFVGLDAGPDSGRCRSPSRRFRRPAAPAAPSFSGRSGSASRPRSSAPPFDGWRSPCNRSLSAESVLLTPVVGLVVGGLAIVFEKATGRSSSQVLFSGQSDLAPVIHNAAGWSLGALTLLMACKALAYGASLSSFRGGPIFPAMFIGAVGG